MVACAMRAALYGYVGLGRQPYAAGQVTTDTTSHGMRGLADGREYKLEALLDGGRSNESARDGFPISHG